MAFQAACIREVLHLQSDPVKRAGLEGAIETIEKVLSARDPIRAVLKIMDVFPDAAIVKQQEPVFPGAWNGRLRGTV